MKQEGRESSIGNESVEGTSSYMLGGELKRSRAEREWSEGAAMPEEKVTERRNRKRQVMRKVGGSKGSPYPNNSGALFRGN